MATVREQTLVFGILNLTPDSFSGGMGRRSYEVCLSDARKMMRQGATHIDVGAESTRPGAQTISDELEWSRLEPFLNLARQENLMSSLSVDTRKPSIMRRAAQMGVSFINCVGGLPDAKILRELKSSHSSLCFMACHMAGEPSNMQEHPESLPKALRSVTDYFHDASQRLQLSGFSSHEIYLDPGIGFGKTDQANWGLLRQTPVLSRHYNLAVGVSRKGFIGRTLAISQPQDRDPASKVVEYALLRAGAKLIRTHDVAGLRRLVDAMSDLGGGA